MGYTIIKKLESTSKLHRNLYYLDNGGIDLPEIKDKISIAQGSEAIDLITGDKWILNSKFVWQKVPTTNGGGSGSGTGGGIADIPNTPNSTDYVRSIDQFGTINWKPIENQSIYVENILGFEYSTASLTVYAHNNAILPELFAYSFTSAGKISGRSPWVTTTPTRPAEAIFLRSTDTAGMLISRVGNIAINSLLTSLDATKIVSIYNLPEELIPLTQNQWNSLANKPEFAAITDSKFDV